MQLLDTLVDVVQVGHAGGHRPLALVTQRAMCSEIAVMMFLHLANQVVGY